jgi:hypothetical protein
MDLTQTRIAGTEEGFLSKAKLLAFYLPVIFESVQY